MMDVSVVLATYNGANFIGEQLASLAAQTSVPFELIVSDDGSVDETLEIVREFSRRVSFPVIIRQNERRLGYGENFLSATKLASGRYIAFCDQDDVWHPDKLANASAILELSNADLFVHAASVIDHEGNRVGQLLQGIKQDRVHRPLQLGPWSVFLGCTMVFPTVLLSLIDASERGLHTFEYDGMLSHDLWVHFLATSLGNVVVGRDPLIDYRQHQGNVTPSILGRGVRAWVRSLGLPANPQLRRGEIASQRSRILRDLQASTSEPAVRQAAEIAAVYWSRISEYESARLDMYLDTAGVRRARKCVKLTLGGGYKSFRNGGLGPRLLLKDILVGVLRASRWKGLAGSPRAYRRSDGGAV